MLWWNLTAQDESANRKLILKFDSFSENKYKVLLFSLLWIALYGTGCGGSTIKQASWLSWRASHRPAFYAKFQAVHAIKPWQHAQTLRLLCWFLKFVASCLKAQLFFVDVKRICNGGARYIGFLRAKKVVVNAVLCDSTGNPAPEVSD